MTPLHKIKKIELDLDFDNHDTVSGLHQRMSTLCKDTLPSFLEDIFNENACKDSVIQLDNIELDLGTLGFEHLEENFLKNLKEKLTEILTNEPVIRKPVLPEIPGNSKIVSSSKKISFADRNFDILRTFLRYGYVPWNSGDFNLYDTLREYISRLTMDNQERKWFSTQMAQNPLFRKRLIFHTKDNEISRILVLLYFFPVELSEYVIKFKSVFIGIMSPGLPAYKIRACLWQVIIKQLQNNPPASESAFLSDLFYSFSKAIKLPLQEFVCAVFEDAVDHADTEELLRKIIPDVLTGIPLDQIKPKLTYKAGALFRQMLRFAHTPANYREENRYPIQERGAKKEPTFSEKNVHLRIEPKNLRRIFLGEKTLVDSGFSDEMEFYEACRTWLKEDIKEREWFQSRIAPSVPSNYRQKDLLEIKQKQFDEFSRVRKEKFKKQRERLTEVFKETREYEAEELHVNNAGLILIAPFFSTFFKNLGYTDDGSFKNTEARIRAIYITQYLVTGASFSEEYDLVLNKVLCGMPINFPLPIEIELTDGEKKEADKLLETVIAYWKALKNTSAGGLRTTFFQRNGILIPEEKQRLLRVERKALDILLEKIPWTYSTIKFNWMDKMLMVEW